MRNPTAVAAAAPFNCSEPNCSAWGAETGRANAPISRADNSGAETVSTPDNRPDTFTTLHSHTFKIRPTAHRPSMRPHLPKASRTRAEVPQNGAL